MFVSVWGQYHANQANNHQQQPPNAHLQPDLHKQHNNFFEKQDFEWIINFTFIEKFLSNTTFFLAT